MSDAGPAHSRDHPDVLAVCRWLPQRYPWGAFTGRHDYIHVGERQGRANLWWADLCVHAGDYVGPPRGGLAPDPNADYDVAMPAGGYLNIRSGVLTDWSERSSAVPVLRADGEVFRPQEYGPGNPYWLQDYQAMTSDDQRNAMAGIRHRRDASQVDEHIAADDLIDAIGAWVRSSSMPDECSCRHASGDSGRRPRGLDIPGAVLRHGGAVATLTGIGDTATARDVIWSLTNALADPDSAGLVRAAEVAARRAADTVAGWPDGPLTEESVALVAAQALRWHGDRIVADLPFWVLGWIFIAKPVFEAVLPDLSQTERARLERQLLDHADQVRVDRVARTWAAAHRAGELLESFTELAESSATITAAHAVIDLRDGPPPPARPAGDLHPAYQRSIAAVVAELSPR